MKVKKVFGLALATAMVLGSSLTAFASSTTPAPSATYDAVTTDNKGVYSTQTTGSASVETPVIKVIVPKTPNVTLNPYGIAIASDVVKETIEGTEYTIASALVGDDTKALQIVAPEYHVLNMSNVPIKITPTFTIKATGITLLDAEPASTDTKNATTKWATITATYEYGTDASGKAAVILGKTYKGTETDPIPAFTIAAATVTGKGTTEAPYVYANVKDAKLTFEGKLNSPAKVATSWTDAEKLELTIKYVFAPQVAE